MNDVQPAGRTWMIVGGLVAGLAVGLGAFGAHWYEPYAEELYADAALQARRIDNWRTATQYQMYHGLALVAVGLAAARQRSIGWRVTGAFFTLGVILFAGSLYAIALSGVADFKTAPKGWYAAIAATPLGGLCFLLGWISFVLASWPLRPAAASTSVGK